MWLPQPALTLPMIVMQPPMTLPGGMQVPRPPLLLPGIWIPQAQLAVAAGRFYPPSLLLPGIGIVRTPWGLERIRFTLWGWARRSVTINIYNQVFFLPPPLPRRYLPFILIPPAAPVVVAPGNEAAPADGDDPPARKPAKPKADDQAEVNP
jgi:hypothetical protein